MKLYCVFLFDIWNFSKLEMKIRRGIDIFAIEKNIKMKRT
jgi:hypothetical protein